MNQKQWDEMSKQQKAEYVVNAEISIKSATGLRADAFVNDPNPCVTMYWVSADGVYISNRHENVEDALREAAASIESYRKDLK